MGGKTGPVVRLGSRREGRLDVHLLALPPRVVFGPQLRKLDEDGLRLGIGGQSTRGIDTCFRARALKPVALGAQLAKSLFCAVHDGPGYRPLDEVRVGEEDHREY